MSLIDRAFYRSLRSSLRGFAYTRPRLLRKRRKINDIIATVISILLLVIPLWSTTSLVVADTQQELQDSSRYLNIHDPQERYALNEGKVDYTISLKSKKQRKSLLCAVFMSTDKSPVSNLYSNVKLTDGACDWALVLYRGNPEDVCKQSWLKSTLALCTSHIRGAKYDMSKSIPKSVLYADLLPILPNYERVILFDEDMLLKGFDLTKFLGVWSCAFTSQNPPLIVQPLIKEHTQYFNYLHAFAWDNYKKQGVVASSTEYIEQQVPGFDSRFLEWYIRRVIGRVMASGFNLEADWGFERMWCSAAKAYSQEVLGRKAGDVVCALLIGADPIHHLHTRTIKARSKNRNEFQRQAQRSMDMYQEFFPSWPIINPLSNRPDDPRYSKEFERAIGVDRRCVKRTGYSS